MSGLKICKQELQCLR